MLKISSLAVAAGAMLLTVGVPTGVNAKVSEGTKAGRAGVRMLAAGRAADAIVALRKAVQKEPNNRTWWLNLGWAANALKHSAEAVKAFNAARKLTKGSDYYGLGYILWGLAEASENAKNCAGLARHLKEWIMLTGRQPAKIQNRKPVKAQLVVARERIRNCPKRLLASRRR